MTEIPLTLGRVLDIERFSTKDGPGIRTVVFFKGCNLHCAWCHNIEGISYQQELSFDSGKCVKCGACVAVCPNNAHSFPDDGHILNRERCSNCFKCADVCYSEALQIIGRDYTIDELLKQISEDEKYYSYSGGGVTLSGGEVMCQKGFVKDLLAALKSRGIHTAIETNLCFPREDYEFVLNWTDYIMADVKTTEEDTFTSYIGNKKQFDYVSDNIDLLRSGDIPFVIRTPVIPGINDKAAVIEDIALKLTGSRSLVHYELLSYHPLGIEKAFQIGSIQDRFQTPSKEFMEQLALSAEKYGVPVVVDGDKLNESW